MSQYTGLTSTNATKLLAEFGPNSLSIKKKNIFLATILSELRNPIMLLLIVAALISYLIGEHAEAIAIAAVVLLNLLFTLFQVYKADNAVSALQKLVLANTIVVRDGQNIQIPTDEVVPGDVVYLEAGSRVPADLRILETTYAQVNESILTGEAALVEKVVADDATGILYMGTMLVVGQVYGKVIAIGISTEFGTIAKQMRNVDESETNLQKKLKKLTKLLGGIGLAGALLVFCISFIQDKNVFESFLLMVSLAVAVVPEGLPAVMTAILSIGVGKMARRGVIMRRLDAIETLGDITILASDKTGTLTQNKMTVVSVWNKNTHLKSLSEVDILTLSFVLNTSVRSVPTIEGKTEYIGDPTEIALREYIDIQDSANHTISQYSILAETPFSSETRTKSVRVKKGEMEYYCINGAPETLLELAYNLTPDKRKEIEQALQECASKGLRTIAFGVGHTAETVHMMGFVALQDPLRPGIQEAISEARAMGIRTILITGDNPLTAESIAVEAGITTKEGVYMTGSMLEQMSDAQLTETLGTVSVFARISPSQKLRLVSLLQASGEIVAMTGDGVNDAPALKKADVGLAMGRTGTDVAKEAADAVITDDNYVTIISGIKEGRAIVRRIELATTFFVAGNIGEFLYVLFALLFGLPLISPLQILFINLITDAVPALALSFAPVKIHKKKQYKKLSGLLQIPEYIYIAIASSILAGSALVVTFVLRGTPDTAITAAFLMLMLVQQCMLVDIWLGLVEHTRELRKLLHTSILGAIALTAAVIVFIFNSTFFTELFMLVAVPQSVRVYFLYAFAVYFAYICTRIEHSK
jgi:P-type Ca2+ transporter type 2C